MHSQFILTSAGFMLALVMAALSARSILPIHTAAINAWSAKRPTIPRQWLVVAFWANLVLPITALGIYAGTSGHFLPAAWNDAAQLLLWLSITIDAVVARSRWWLVVPVVFLAFSAYEVTTHL